MVEIAIGLKDEFIDFAQPSTMPSKPVAATKEL